MPESIPSRESARPHLGQWDAVSIIVGIVVGVGIYETAPLILASSGGPWTAMGLWLLGGVLSLVGALCYAELATAYPQSGGDYIYLTRAYGRWAGFLFGWAQLTVIMAASIGSMAFVFADYGVRLRGLAEAAAGEVAAAGEEAAEASAEDPSATTAAAALAVVAVAVLTLANIWGAASGRRMQNLLTALKVVGLGGIVLCGLFWGSGNGLPEAAAANDAAAGADDTAATAAASIANFGLAMILILYTFGGWNDAAFVAAEIREPQRNIPRALLWGVGCVTAIYLVVNAAYIWGLGFDTAAGSSAIAADMFALGFGENGARAMCLLVMVSALAACNGLIFAGARIYARLGADHAAFRALGRWHGRLGVPLHSLLLQGAVCIAMILAVGSTWGRAAVNAALAAAGLAPAEWTGHGGFETLLTCSAPIFWMFFLLTGVSLMVLRVRDPQRARPFRVPLYPLVPLVFCGMCLAMLYASVQYLRAVELLGGFLVLGVLPVALGLPVYFISRTRRPAAE